MKIAPSEIEPKLIHLKQALEDLFTFFRQGYDYHTMIYDLWDAKDILGHLTFWHESFAANISDLGEGRKPHPLKGRLSEVNATSVKTTRPAAIEDLILRLKQAQECIEEHIYNEGIYLIPYKKGSRPYSRLEHLEVVAHHITKHLRDLNKKINRGKAQNKS